MRLIDADALYDEFRGVHPDTAMMYASAVAQVIKDAPEINPETLPIMHELRKQLEQVTKERDAAIKDLNITSQCFACKKDCPILEACSKRHKGICEEFEWRGI